MSNRNIVRNIMNIVKKIIFWVITMCIILYSYNNFNQRRYDVSKEVIFQISNSDEEEDLTNLDKEESNDIVSSKSSLSGNNGIFDASADSYSKAVEDESIDVLDESESNKETAEESQNKEKFSTEKNQITTPVVPQTIEESPQDFTFVLEEYPAYVWEGQNPTEGLALMTYINQYRTDLGIGLLTWNFELEQNAQILAKNAAIGEGEEPTGFYSCYMLKQLNYPQDAQCVVYDWIYPYTNGSAIEACPFLNGGYTEIGAALYFLPSDNKEKRCYTWVVCLM